MLTQLNAVVWAGIIWAVPALKRGLSNFFWLHFIALAMGFFLVLAIYYYNNNVKTRTRWVEYLLYVLMTLVWAGMVVGFDCWGGIPAECVFCTTVTLLA